MTFYARGAALALTIALFGTACTDSVADTAADEPTESTAVAGDAADGAETTEATGTIVEVASEAGNFATLLAAAEAAGLVDTLNGEGPYTVFAPTDDAFTAMLQELELSPDDLLASPELADILTYHVIAGDVSAAEVVTLDGQAVPTVNGAELTITVDGDTVMVDDATVTATDISASNGTIHVIDGVLVP